MRLRGAVWWLLLLLLSHAAAPRTVAADTTNRQARLKVSGNGWIGNWELKKTLRVLQSYKEEQPRPDFYNADFIEDSALIILSQLGEDGFLNARVATTITMQNGAVTNLVWTKEFDTLLPRPLRATSVHFDITKGVLFHYDALRFVGLETIPESRALRFFIETGTLFRLKSMMIYTPHRLEASMENLQLALNRQGYEFASVSVTNLVVNDTTGAVQAEIHVDQGPISLVRSVRTEIASPEPVQQTNTARPNTPFSRVWEQDFSQTIKTNFYRQGFPDVSVRVSTVERTTGDNTNELDLLAAVDTGPRIRQGQVSFEGANKTRMRTLTDRVTLREGELLNPIEVEQGRYRLSRLGIFDSVGVRYDPAGQEDTRDVTYELNEGKSVDFSLILGYGSYELIRGGFELEQHNVWGRAHQSRLRAMQSVRASSGDYLYTLPELFLREVDAYFNASALRREEISFTREEYAAGVGAHRSFASINSDVSLGYNYELLTASDVSAALPDTVRRAKVSSIKLELKHDQRDNPLLPRKGYKMFSQFEWASDRLGGEVDYQRVEVGSSVHFKVGPAQFVHLGLSHGALTTFGGIREQLPFNKRFFPGGENSVRGFQLGEAAPRNADGDLVGAETYLQGNLELEQALTPTWSFVAFFDGVGIAEDIADYPFTEQLYSVGGGIRWKTFIGPARLEYGRNLNPRHHDPSGTIHFSIGFPF